MIKGTFDVNKPSEEARYLASWLKLYEYEFTDLKPTGNEYGDSDDWYISINEERLVKTIDNYFNSRK